MGSTRAIGILGGGPAGLSAALWLKNLGFAPWIADVQALGGGMLNLNFLANDWVLGHVGLTGPQLSERFADHVKHLDIPFWTACRPQQIERKGNSFTVILTDTAGQVRQANCAALLIATGTNFRGPEAFASEIGLNTLPVDRCVYGPYAFSDMKYCRDKRLLIVGGGDNAFENARLLLGCARSIDMVLRSPPRAQRILREAVAGGVRVHQPGVLTHVAMSGDVIFAGFHTEKGDVTIEVDRMHVLVGYKPNTEFLTDAFGSLAVFRHDRDGYLETDAAGRTVVPGVYAAGDVCNPGFPSVVAALAHGARAAKTIELDLR